MSGPARQTPGRRRRRELGPPHDRQREHREPWPAFGRPPESRPHWVVGDDASSRFALPAALPRTARRPIAGRRTTWIDACNGQRQGPGPARTRFGRCNRRLRRDEPGMHGSPRADFRASRATNGGARARFREHATPSPESRRGGRRFGPAVDRYGTISTCIPIGPQSNIHAATSNGRLMQPWLIGVPKLLCQ